MSDRDLWDQLNAFKLEVERRFSRVQLLLVVLAVANFVPKFAGIEPSSITTAAVHLVGL